MNTPYDHATAAALAYAERSRLARITAARRTGRVVDGGAVASKLVRTGGTFTGTGPSTAAKG